MGHDGVRDGAVSGRSRIGVQYFLAQTVRYAVSDQSRVDEDSLVRKGCHQTAPMSDAERRVQCDRLPNSVDVVTGPRIGAATQGPTERTNRSAILVPSGIPDLCAHMLRHTWATNFHRSRSGSRLDLMAEGGWTTGRMVERYAKTRPFDERRRAPSPFTASREARKEKRPVEEWPSQRRSALSENRTANRANIHAVV
jgi:hypothetical protein